MYRNLFCLTFLPCPSVLNAPMGEAKKTKQLYAGLPCHSSNKRIVADKMVGPHICVSFKFVNVEIFVVSPIITHD